MMKNCVLKVGVTLILFVLVFVQAKSQNLENIEFKYLTPDQGLSQSTVEAIYQDSEGFMWFGTYEGLNKYEGQNEKMVVYKHDSEDPNSLGSNEIEDIYEDRNGNLWIAADWGGLNLYNREKDNFTRYTAAQELHIGRLSDNTIHTLLEDSKGNFWVGTFKGLNLMDRGEGTFKNYVREPGNSATLSNNYITEIYEDKSGNVWVGTANGLNRMHINADSVTFERFYQRRKSQSHPSNYIHVAFEDNEGNFWIGTESGLYIFDRKNNQFQRANIDGIPASSAILTIVEDWKGVRWIGTDNDGLFALPAGSNTPFQFKYSESEFYGINSSSVYSLYESRDNILWVGTFDGGLNILNRKDSKFEHFKNIPGKDNSLNENSIFSFLQPRGRHIWIGTDGGGINLFDPKTEHVSVIKHQPGNTNSLPSNVILDMLEDSKNRIWLGTYNGGLVRYNRNTEEFKTYNFQPDNPHSLGNPQVFSLLEDRNGNIWAGTNGGGLSKLVDEQAGIFERWHPNSDSTFFEQSFIRDMYEDSQGEIWVASYGGGITRFNPKTGDYKTFNSPEEGLNSNVVLDIYVPPNGTMWVGTKGGGMARYNPETDQFETFTTKDGLPNDIVNALLKDDNGNIWASTNNGISRFNPATGEFKNFDLSDGLQSREFKPDAAYKSDDGFMYFGGINGFNRFHPDSIYENTKVSPVVLTNFSVDNKLVPIGSNYLEKHINHTEYVELPYSVSIISFNYSVLNYNPEQGYTYAYMLEGFDKDWNQVGQQNMATYTNLDPGEYTFKVKTANSDGIWGEQIKQVGLIITPPFWLTSWFYVLAAFSIMGLIVGGFKYRTRQIMEHNRRLEQEVYNRTSELQESNQELKRALKDLKETREELVENAHKAGMADIATGVLHNIGNVLNSVTTSTAITADVLEKTKLEKLFKANELLREHKDNLEEFLTHNPKGQKLTDYYLKLDEALKQELKLLKSHNKRLDKKVTLINDVISAQQTYAGVGVNHETSNVKLMLEDALTIFSNSLDRHSITVEKDISDTSPVLVQKTKLVHVILNILKNAKDAMLSSDSDYTEKRLNIKLYEEDERVCLEISDTGPGIKKEHVDKVFAHGFTTKKNGHGFGLHSSANYMKEMGAKLVCRTRKKEKAPFLLLRFP